MTAVVVDISPLRSPLSGIGRYTFELCLGLSSNDFVDNLYFWNGVQFVKAPQGGFDRDSLAAIAHVQRGMSKRVLRVLRSIGGRMKVVRSSSDLEGAIFHGTNYFVPRKSGFKTISVVHDLSVFRFPDHHQLKTRVVISRAIKNAVEHSLRIVVDSNRVQEELEGMFPETAGRISTVPLGVSPDFLSQDVNEHTAILQGYGLRFRSYVLVLGSIEPRKNIERIVRAHMRLRKSVRKGYPLVIAGPKGWKNRSIRSLIQREVASGSLKELGFVPEEHLPGLLAGARCLAFPSLYEGFGLPVLEAMASGTLVVTSEASPMADTLGGFGWLVDPRDTQSIASGLNEVLSGTESEQRRKRIEAVRRSQDYSWQKTVQRTVEVYKELVSIG